ncbi:hypothetical protein ACNKHQ_15200 [Shigella flexneri]
MDRRPLLVSGNEFTALDVTLDISPFGGSAAKVGSPSFRFYPFQHGRVATMKNGERCFVSSSAAGR